MARLVLLSEGLTGQTYELKSEKTTVGRLPDNAFQIPEASVSSHHCEITLRGSELFVHDLDSTNGTFLGGKRISSPTQITLGTPIKVGATSFELRR